MSLRQLLLIACLVVQSHCTPSPRTADAVRVDWEVAEVGVSALTPDRVESGMVESVVTVPQLVHVGPLDQSQLDCTIESVDALLADHRPALERRGQLRSILDQLRV